MCRLMGYVSEDKSHFSTLAGPAFSNFIKLSSIHCDGWGIATINKDDTEARLDKAAEQAATSDQFDLALSRSESDGALLHLRWATKGLPVSENNAHPFTHMEYSFIHNGAIYPSDALNAFIAPHFLGKITGNTDSESYFFLLLTEIERFGLVEGIQSGMRIIKERADYSSINAMLMNEKFMAVICEHDPLRKPDFGAADYYELKYKSDGKSVIVASTGWDQADWVSLDNHQIMVVNRESLEISVLPI